MRIDLNSKITEVYTVYRVNCILFYQNYKNEKGGTIPPPKTQAIFPLSHDITKEINSFFQNHDKLINLFISIIKI